MSYTLPDLNYDYAALEPNYASEILELHHDKHHRAYVDGANETLEALAAEREKGDFDRINLLEKNLAFHLSGHMLHSLLWVNLSPQAGGSPGGELATAVQRDFGGFDDFKAQMTAAALDLQGSGWATLSWEPLGKRLLVQQVYDHQANIANGSVPLLVLDMWEHAYYLQFKNEKAKWVKSYWDIVDWADVGDRFRKVRELNLVL